jgi:ATP-dependent RNA helicase DDX35
MLVREMMRDPLLSRMSVVMLDEAHERTLYMDIVVGLLYKIQKKRPDLRLIISSATLDAQAFQTFFNHGSTSPDATATATILQVDGRTYPVDIFYASAPVPDYVAATADAIVDLHLSMPEGDILAFLTGQDEVDKVVELVQSRLELAGARSRRAALVLPMYGGLVHQEQMRVFDRAPENTRKIVVATNIAEASVTIEGIVYVVDCGFVKIKGYNPVTGIECLVVSQKNRATFFLFFLLRC